MTVMRRALPYAIAVLVVLAALPLAAWDDSSPFRSDQKFANGLWMLTFQAPEGQIRLNMPERMWQGELASGTIELFPRGEGTAFADNLAALQDYSVRLEGEELAASSRSFRWRPGQANSRIELIDRTGTAVSASPAIIASREGKRPEGPYVLPTLVQRGNTFIVRGPFDGDFANTRLLLGGKAVEKVAESFELLVVRNTAERLGRLRAVVAEGTARQRASLNSFEIALSAPKGAAAPGGKMTVRLRIEGLEGLREQFQVALYNHRPEVASIDGARMPFQRIVRTEEIGADGAFQLDLGTSVKGPGEVSIFAAVAAGPVPHMVDVTWPPHVPNVTYPPYHVPNVTFPPHQGNVTFPPYHVVNVTFPPHTTNVTYPPGHVPNFTWPPHLENGTFPPYHVPNLTFPPHYEGVSFPPYHQTNVTWPPHFPTVTFPPYHQKAASWPPHYVGFTFLPQKDEEVDVEAGDAP
ncbi:MAG TPA: hypothetical protein VF179_07485 [Thermoanaerobaculia bacterium]|nr:hypothetical protein [Thermoanaerobaculia bacterium]